MKNKIVVPKSTFDIKQFSKDMGNVVDSFRALSDSNKRERIAFFEGIVLDVQKILETGESNGYILRDLIKYKQQLQFKKAPPAYEYEVKRIDEAISLVIEPALQNLSELIRLDKELGISNQIPLVKTEKAEIAIEPPLNELNANVSELIPKKIIINNRLKIKMNLSKTIIFEHFNKLNNFKNELNNQAYLPKDDVEQLLCQAFEEYTDKPTDHKLLSLNLTNKQFGIFYCFIYQFYSRNETKRAGTKMKYAHFLKDNFENFSQLEIHTLYSSIRLNNDLESSIDLLKKSPRS